MDAIKLTLPWPPSVNGYWRAVNGRQILSKRGREYRQRAQAALLQQRIGSTLTCPVRVTERFFPPDNRRRDLDNARKAYRDALGHFGVWADDSQVVEDHGFMCDSDPANPRVEVTIERSV